MSIVNDGFSFSNDTRGFFAKYFQVKQFKFTMHMVHAVKKARIEQDVNFKVKDLIDLYEHGVKYGNKMSKEDEKTLQWNTFVRDISKSPQMKDYHSRMKVSAVLWKVLRNSKGEKHFYEELFDENFDQIKEYHK